LPLNERINMSGDSRNPTDGWEGIQSL
jgi:hypothetical protein